MVQASWTARDGWTELQVRPHASLTLAPSAMVLHYGQAVFEGLKAYVRPTGGAALFMPSGSARRFACSARRLAMPELPEDVFIRACAELVRVDLDAVPADEGTSLYLRPILIATEANLGVRPSNEYLFSVIASPVDGFFAGVEAIEVWCPGDQSRAAPGGTGAAKCSGNYAGTLQAKQEALKRGCHEVLWLDATEHRYVEELGAMNVVFVLADGSLVTPPLVDSILAGNTRNCVLQLARDLGRKVRERPVRLDELVGEAGAVQEAFACGTAAGVVPIARVTTRTSSALIGSGHCGQVTMQLREMLTGIQTGIRVDEYGWTLRVAP